jgi:hypothetical protein
MRRCNNCTLCCSLLGVHELKKLPLQDCPHCEVNVKCKIYETRPKECQNFDCLWLLGKCPENLKPDQSHVVLSDLEVDLKQELQGRVIIVYSDPLYPDAYKTGEVRDYLNALLKEGVELILVKEGKKMLMKWGKVEE